MRISDWSSDVCSSDLPPEDLVLRPSVQEACRAAIGELAVLTTDGGPGMVVGTPWVDDGKLFNAAALLDGGAVAALRYNHELPNYDVFDEKRVFAAGPRPEEHTSELQSLMRITYAVFCLKKKMTKHKQHK